MKYAILKVKGLSLQIIIMEKVYYLLIIFLLTLHVFCHIMTLFFHPIARLMFIIRKFELDAEES